MRVIVCDDDPLARKYLCDIIEKQGHEVSATASTGIEAINKVKKYAPDVVLLDICMPEMDGISCAKELEKLPISPAIIFVTAYDNYAYAAFKSNASGYLLKPADPKELANALKRASIINNAQLNEFDSAKEITLQPPFRQHIIARTHRGVELIPLVDIYYFTADQKYVQVRHKNGTILIDETLKQLEYEFQDLFFRIHRNALINLSYLELLETVDLGQVQVSFKDINDKLFVSRRHLPLLRAKIQTL